MKLAEVLRGKNQVIYKIKAQQSIADAAVSLTENKIGALLVEDDSGGIVGILSERDIVGSLFGLDLGTNEEDEEAREAWAREYEIAHADELQRLRDDFRGQRVYELTHNPLLLTGICLVHRSRGGQLRGAEARGGRDRGCGDQARRH